MKNFSLSTISLIAAVIIALSLSSCSRKVGCYFSLAPEIESGWNINSTALGSNQIDVMPVNVVEIQSTCD